MLAHVQVPGRAGAVGDFENGRVGVLRSVAVVRRGFVEVPFGQQTFIGEEIG
jgi:hypothetical protein